ncbi:lytic transglycosylase domain-containing protein [Virgibacillus sediminis]|uniref:Lytic transglycosylase domain-containing protein n=1 Tax=Virgibacillus sediminis TaxID=202260 RepID=A0ABV7A6W4_9BACI
MQIRDLQMFTPASQSMRMTSARRETAGMPGGLGMNFHQLLQEKINRAILMTLTQQDTIPGGTAYHTAPPESLKSTTVKPESIGNSTTNQIDSYVKEAAAKYGISEKLIHSVIKTESNYNIKARSGAGAEGLMQLMPATARGLGVADSFNPRQNIDGGAKYLSQMLNRYNGNLKLALAAYNAGPGNVDKYQGIPPFKETKNYVSKVMNTYST